MRCFIAVETDSQTAKRLSGVSERLQALDLDATFPKEFHITLCFFGEISEEKLQQKIEALKDFQFKPFQVKVAGLGFFPNENFVRVAWAGVQSAELLELQKTIAGLLNHDAEEFRPHVTLARIKAPKNKDKLKEFAKQNQPDFGTFTVEKILLKKSTLTPSGPVYENLHEWKVE